MEKSWNWGKIYFSSILLIFTGIFCIYLLDVDNLLDSKPFPANYHKQIFFAITGIIIFYLVSRININLIKWLASPFYILCLFSLLALFLFGSAKRGACSWFDLGLFSIQPAEFTKLALVLMLSKILSETNQINIKTTIVSLVIFALPVLPVLLQPDFGTAVVFVPILFCILLAKGIRFKTILIYLFIFVVAGVCLYFSLLKDYQRERVKAFFARFDQKAQISYQQKEALRSIGYGGLGGDFYVDKNERPVFFVPDRHTDFIFTVIAEKFGFAGSVATVFLYWVFFTSLVNIGFVARDEFTRLVVFGCFGYMFFQCLLNLFVCVGFLPITGVTLIYLSYGGSSIISTLLAMGVIRACVR